MAITDREKILQEAREYFRKMQERQEQIEAESLRRDQDAVYAILQAQKACEWGELKARAYKIPNITQKHVYDACMELERQGKVGNEHVQIRCSFPPSRPPLFLYSMSADPTERQQTIDAKAQLLAQHYDNTKIIGAHAEELVKKVCADLDYTRISQDKSVGNHDIDVYAKHPSKRFWQAISVKNWRDSIKPQQVQEILEIVNLARDKWKKKNIRPAIVASYAYHNVIQNQDHVPVAVYEKQVAPESCRGLCESLNEKLAFDFEITDNPPENMRRNIAVYICKHDYERDQQPARQIAVEPAP